MRVLHSFGLVLACLFMLTACSGQRMYQAPAISAPVRAHDAEVRRAVKKALLRRGWTIERDWREATYAKVSHGKHNARVRVRYSGNRVYIEYVSSKYLKYRMKQGEPIIHKRYNYWIMELEEEISTQLASIHPHGTQSMLAVRSESIRAVGYTQHKQYPHAYQGTYAGEYHSPPSAGGLNRSSRIDVRLENADKMQRKPALRDAAASRYLEPPVSEHISEKDIVPSRMIQHNPRRRNPAAAVGGSRGAVNLDEIYY